MKKASIVFTLALIAGLWVSGEALACGRRCANVAPPGSTPCLRCIEDENSTVDCRNSAGSCGCFFVQCNGLSKAAAPGKETEEAVLASIFSDGNQAETCSTLPSEITDSVAE
jgi:hypothetical protein